MTGELYTLNAQRLAHWDEALALADQTPAFMQCHRALVQAMEHMKECCDTELEKDSLHGAQRDVLNSLNNHWSGLSVFVQFPQVPMDNNTAERRMRNLAMGRKNYYGSGCQWSGELAAMMFSLFQTVLLWQLNPHHWLYSYLSACAQHGGQDPPDLSPFLPWEMNEERKRLLSKPLQMATPNVISQQQLSPPLLL